MLPITRAVHLAKQAGAEKVEVSIEDLERLLEQRKVMDTRLAECMTRLSSQDYQDVFGDMFADVKAD